MEIPRTKNAEVEEIVEKLLKLQEESREKRRPEQTKSAPSTPLIEQRSSRPYANHDIYKSRHLSPTRGGNSPSFRQTNLHCVHSLPAHCPVPQSYQPMYLKTANFSKTNRHGLKHLSRSTPTMSPSGSPPHSDSEGQSHVSRRTKKFLRRFRNVSATERVINYYACAIVSDILWQGTLYITDNYFAFYSNIFGYVNRTLIPINDVSSIRKERTAKFIPNAVGLHTVDGKTIVFSSLISRDATYKFMTHIWKKSKKIDDSDKDMSLQVPEEHFLNDSASNSGDSALEDNVDYNEEEAYYPPSLPKIGRTSPSDHVALKELGGETSVTNSENDSSYTTPETGVSTSSFMEVHSSIDPVGTSTSENEIRVIRRGNIHQKPIQANSKMEMERQKVEWSVRSAVMENAVNIGVAPFRAVKVGLQEITYMPNNSAILIISSGVIFFLLLSAVFMIYRVETLNNQLNADSNQHGDLYEEVLKMQQKLHAATTKEISKALNSQISQLVTVRQSLEALIFLLDADQTNQPPQVSEHSYS